MARTGMAYLINLLRGLTEAGYDDYKLGTLVYWTDDTLQDVLDLHRAYMNYTELESVPTYGEGTVSYIYFKSGIGWQESSGTMQTTGGTAVAGTAYTFTPQTGEFVFAKDTAGAGYTWTNWAFDLYAAASDVWRRKAAHYAAAYDFSTDNHTLHRSQLITQARTMASYYASLSASGQSISVERSDT